MQYTLFWTSSTLFNLYQVCINAIIIDLTVNNTFTLRRSAESSESVDIEEEQGDRFREDMGRITEWKFFSRRSRWCMRRVYVVKTYLDKNQP